ncbi:MAG TPA: hypothetical protein DD490_04990 [Acidobacteria bacterium]|nr:hypothetical protein [Acidobacteriota bacterium]
MAWSACALVRVARRAARFSSARADAALKAGTCGRVGRVDQCVVQVESADLIGVEVLSQSPQCGGLAGARALVEVAAGVIADSFAPAP